MIGVILALTWTYCAETPPFQPEEVKENFVKKLDTQIKNPLKMRDPFRRNLKSDTEGVKKNFQVDKTDFSNKKELPLGPLADLKVVGVLIGDERKAMVKVGDEKAQIFLVTEGMIIGENSAELKAILPGGIVVVEKLENVYGEPEYLETVIPIAN